MKRGSDNRVRAPRGGVKVQAVKPPGPPSRSDVGACTAGSLLTVISVCHRQRRRRVLGARVCSAELQKVADVARARSDRGGGIATPGSLGRDGRGAAPQQWDAREMRRARGPGCLRATAPRHRLYTVVVCTVYLCICVLWCG